MNKEIKELLRPRQVALSIVHALAEGVRSHGEISGVALHAMVMDRVSIELYNKAIKKLVGLGVVQQDKSGVIKWIGPTTRDN